MHDVADRPEMFLCRIDDQTVLVAHEDVVGPLRRAGQHHRRAAVGCHCLVAGVDSRDAARALRDFSQSHGVALPALVEIDTDDHRAGVKPDAPELLAIGEILGPQLSGVMTHAGNSYTSRSADEIRAWAKRERQGVVHAATRLRAAGHRAPVVSVGSTPTAFFGDSFEGVTEVRAGVYTFMDLVMAGLGVCAPGEIAMSVLATVIGHQAEKGWIITDAGWTALSRDRGTAAQTVDQGYGLVCDVDGSRLDLGNVTLSFYLPSTFIGLIRELSAGAA